MRKIVKALAHQVLRTIDLHSLYYLRKEGQLKEDGWFKSYRDHLAVDSNGAPIPWWTYSAIKFIGPRLSKSMKVFEYGCGNSTLWLSGLVDCVVAVEHNPAWSELIQNKAPENVSVILRSVNNGYAAEILKHSVKFDVVIIDGRNRVECAKSAIQMLGERGAIIWDNAERLEDTEGYKTLIDKGLRRLDFSSMGPINTYAWTTSVFYKRDNCLEI